MNEIFSSMTPETMEVNIRYIGSIYKRSRKRMDIYEFQNCVKENQEAYSCDQGLVHLIDRTLQDCSAETKCIIRKEYLETNPTDWYTEYFAKSSYYRLKKLALEEFMHCLNI